MTTQTLTRPLPTERHPRRARIGRRIALLVAGAGLAVVLALIALAWRASDALMDFPPAHYAWGLQSYPALARVAEPLTVHSRTGVVLTGRFFPGRSEATIVLSHGYGGDEDEMLPVANMLHAAGFTVVTYNERGRDGSGGHGTWGALETTDLRSVIDAVVRHPGVDPGAIGELGFSIGSDVSILEAARDRRVKAVVAVASWPSLSGYMHSELSGHPAEADGDVLPAVARAPAAAHRRGPRRGDTGQSHRRDQPPADPAHPGPRRHRRPPAARPGELLTRPGAEAAVAGPGPGPRRDRGSRRGGDEPPGGGVLRPRAAAPRGITSALIGPAPARTRLVRETTDHGRWVRAVRAADPRLRAVLDRDLIGFEQERAEFSSWLEPPRPALTLMVDFEGELALDGTPLPHDWIAGLSDRYAVVGFGPRYASLDLKFTPLGAWSVLGMPLGDLEGQTIQLEDAFGRAGRGLVDELRAALDWDARFDIVEAFLLSRLGAGRRPEPAVVWALGRLQESEGRERVESLAAQLGCSRRYLHTRFREQVGLAPKSVARLIRFDAVRRHIERSPGRWADVAHACGYADQSHLNRDFRQLAGTTPRDFVARLLPDSGGVVGDGVPFLQDGAGSAP